MGYQVDHTKLKEYLGCSDTYSDTVRRLFNQYIGLEPVALNYELPGGIPHSGPNIVGLQFLEEAGVLLPESTTTIAYTTPSHNVDDDDLPF